MPWRSPEDRTVFSPFAIDLLMDSDTLFRWVQNEKNEGLEWDSLENDAQTFLDVAQLIWDSCNLSDSEFIKNIHPKIIELLRQSEIFKRLDDKNIIVTPAHEGTTPFAHSLNVLEAMVTDGMGLYLQQVFILRLGAYYHDSGKAISAGISKYKAEKMKNEAHSRHSYPNHDLVSTEVLKAFGKSETVQQFIQVIGQHTWDMFLLMIDNHHFFEFKESTSEEYLKLLEIMKNVVKDPVQFEAFLLSYAFAYADIMSNPAYVHYWSEKDIVLDEVFGRLELEINLQLLELLKTLQMELAVRAKYKVIS